MMLGFQLQWLRNDESIALLKDAVARQPADADCRFELGRAYMTGKQYVDCVNHLSEAIKIDPQYWAAHELIIVCHLGTGDQRAARIALDRMIRLQPPITLELCNLINRFAANGLYTDAFSSYNYLLSRKSANSHLALTEYADLLINAKSGLRDAKKTIDLARKACEATQWKNMGSVAVLAAAYAEVGDFDRAVECQKLAMAEPSYVSRSGAVGRQALESYGRRQPYRNSWTRARNELAPPPRPGRDEPGRSPKN